MANLKRKIQRRRSKRRPGAASSLRTRYEQLLQSIMDRLGVTVRVYGSAILRPREYPEKKHRKRLLLKNNIEATLVAARSLSLQPTFGDPQVPVSSQQQTLALTYTLIAIRVSSHVTEGLAIPLYRPLLSGFVNLTNPAALAAATVSVGSISNTMPADIPAGVVFSSNDIGTISTNLIAMNFNARWDSFRRANADVYPRGIYSSLGEVVEVSGLGSSAPGGAELNKSQLEGRARVVYESLTPVSDTFTIYSVGEAAEVTTIGGLSRTNWLGGKRLKSQVSWVPVRNAAGEVVRDGDGVPAYRLKQGWTLPVITPD